MISLDTETTGADFAHGARPFLVTTCSDQGDQTWWEWDVDPITRDVRILDEDKRDIRLKLSFGPEIVMQNAKFDVTALAVSDIIPNWQWNRTHDTLIMAHLLHSSPPHDLTALAIQYLGRNIQPFEDRIARATKQARDYCRRYLKDWAIADTDRDDMPSVKNEKKWKVDMWLPRAIIKAGEFKPEDHEDDWLTVCSDYANEDSKTTIQLADVFLREIDRRGYMEVYKARMKVLRPTYTMQKHGVTYSERELVSLRDEYTDDSTRLGNNCVNVAASYKYDLVLPKSGNNRSLMDFCFSDKLLGLPVVAWTDTGNPSLNKEAMAAYEVTLAKNSKQRAFIEALRDKRKCDTAVTYMNGYERFSIPLENGHGPVPGFRRIFPNLNPTGTYTTRFSHNNPNEANISKKDGFNLRRIFGPAPGREWWTFDGKNMELVFPAYKCGEEAMIQLFERPNDPPYFGSHHLLVAHILWPKEFEQCIKEGIQTSADEGFKKRYKATLYDRVKRGNFAVQYDAGDETADAAYGVKGARRLLRERFRKQAELSDSCKRFANKYGYVETFPDVTVDPNHGFPIVCKVNDFGKVKSTVPFSNVIQGSVGWWMMMCMIHCDDYLEGLNRKTNEMHFMTLQVHDELAFDFPAGTGPEPWRTNLPKAMKIRSIMEQCGRNLGIPVRVSMEYHSTSYASGMEVAA